MKRLSRNPDKKLYTDGKLYIHNKFLPDEPGKIHQRNPVNPIDFDYKPINKTLYDQSAYKYNFDKINKLDPLGKTIKFAKNLPESSEPTHYENYLIHKYKEFTRENKDLAPIQKSEIVDSSTYKEARQNIHSIENNNSLNTNSATSLPRKNLYVTRPFANLNPDIKQGVASIKFRSSISDDTPGWFQGPSKFYTKENLDMSKKMKKTMQLTPDTDIIGNKLPNYEKLPETLSMELPFNGVRMEKSRMLIYEKGTKIQPGDLQELRKAHINIDWKEEPGKQNYDLKVSAKVNTTDRPFIKTLEAKKHINPHQYWRIGEADNTKRLKSEKPVELKIGHSDGQYTIAKKDREDGCFSTLKHFESGPSKTSTQVIF